MKRLTSSLFRRTYLAESEPVEVTAYEKVIGYWYPVGTEPTDGQETTTEAPDEPYRFTIRPALRPRPNMVATTKPVFDPAELRKQEQKRGDEFQPRAFGPRRKT